MKCFKRAGFVIVTMVIMLLMFFAANNSIPVAAAQSAGQDADAAAERASEAAAAAKRARQEADAARERERLEREAAAEQARKEAETAAAERAKKEAEAAAAAPQRIDGNVLSARLIYSPSPIYPQAARADRVSGVVVLDVEVDEYGDVTSVTVKSGPDLLRQAAIDAVKQWKYSPILLNGEPIPVVAEIRVTFSLN